MAPKVTLTYFGARARGELVRLILAYGGIDYEDIRLTQEEWPAIKPSKQIKFEDEQDFKISHALWIR